MKKSKNKKRKTRKSFRKHRAIEWPDALTGAYTIQTHAYNTQHAQWMTKFFTSHKSTLTRL